ncbi:Organic cation transporter protein [Hordeum vulgare]|nr:Organic cation transporter protein [Hordeum vulgare]
MGQIVEDYDGKKDPTSVVLDGLYVWAQIRGIPDMYRDADTVDQLARRIGRVKQIQLSPRLFCEGDYVRVRARVLVGKPLTRITSLTVTGEGRRMLPIKYEKIPYFCQVCGFIGHNHEECGDGVWEAKQKQWGSWMLAQRKKVALGRKMKATQLTEVVRGVVVEQAEVVEVSLLLARDHLPARDHPRMPDWTWEKMRRKT